VLATLPALLLSWSGAAAAKLDKDDREWLDEVALIILAEEREAYERLEDKADREEFRKIFWARRDPDLATPENEFRSEYEAARAKADRDYGVGGRVGSLTDCGRVFVLLGEPDEVQFRRRPDQGGADPRHQPGQVSAGLRTPETWIYRDKPGQTFTGGEAAISFDEECRAPTGVEEMLEPVAASKVTQPQLQYGIGADGHLVTLEEQLPKESPTRALLNSPRQDFPIEIDTSYLRVSEDQTGVIGLVRGEAPDLPVETREGEQVVDVVVATSVLDDDGNEKLWTEQPVQAEVQPDGSFMASYGLSVAPGDYTLNVGVVIGEGPLGSLVAQPIEVPNLAPVETAEDGSSQKLPSAASILFIREILELPPDEPADLGRPYAAFRLGQTQLIPHFGRNLSQSDTVSFFYFIYDLPVDPATGAADATVSFRILKAGEPLAQAPDTTATTRNHGSAVGPVPLSGLSPGAYVAQLKVTERVQQRTVIRNEQFKVTAAEAEAEAAAEEATP
jgi:GWxTD domain-containing protein